MQQTEIDESKRIAALGAFCLWIDYPDGRAKRFPRESSSDIFDLPTKEIAIKKANEIAKRELENNANVVVSVYCDFAECNPVHRVCLSEFQRRNG